MSKTKNRNTKQKGKVVAEESIPKPAGKKTGKKENGPLQLKNGSLFSDIDIHLFNEGRHFRLYEKFGSHVVKNKGIEGTYFAVWAPNAEKVSLVGDFNGWDKASHPMKSLGVSGIWELFVPGVSNGTLYKYHIESGLNGYVADKGDPFAIRWETPPATASVVWDTEYKWKDSVYLNRRMKGKDTQQPMSVYELHIGSWKRNPEDNNRSLTYRELAEQLPEYLKEMGFTQVEFMPVMEHPFYGSWGYQVTGYFAPSSRYGSPDDFMHLVDELHKKGIGVILDWVPSHFPTDEHGLGYFDGTHLYEHSDKRKGFHPDWQSLIFNYGRNEVRSFLISNAFFWIDKFHADGLRVDAVASMLYLDYSRKEGEWIPNEHGGRENLEAISFLKEFNESVYREFPDVVTIAEESTAWPKVSRPTYLGGLGFGQKWMMGWMHDTLNFYSKDPLYRQHHHNDITFSLIYAFTENFMLPLSHDEVVYGKGSMINKMPGDNWQKFANLRNLYAYMYGHPGTKLLFMGSEFGQWQEWSHERSLDWHLLDDEFHGGLLNFVKDLNELYKKEEALHVLPFEEEGFEWLDTNDWKNSTISFIRKSKDGKKPLVVICNFTPVMRENYRIGVPKKGYYKEVLNSDNNKYMGSGVINYGIIESERIETHGRENSVSLTLPPLGVVYLKWLPVKPKN